LSRHTAVFLQVALWPEATGMAEFGHSVRNRTNSPSLDHTTDTCSRSVPQRAQNLSMSPTSPWQWVQVRCNAYLQPGQKLNRALTMVPHFGQWNGSGSRAVK